MIRILATGFGTGYTPYISGTAGTLVGIPIFYFLSRLNGGLYLLITVGLTLFAIWISNLALPLYTDPQKKTDPKQIVIDEVVGFLWTAGILRYAAFWDPKEGLLSLLIISFGLFRLFDVTKPGPVGWAERKFSKGLGIVMDDVVAGILAGVAGILFCILYPLLLSLFV